MENGEFRGEDQWTESQTSVKNAEKQEHRGSSKFRIQGKEKKWRRLKATSLGGWGRLWENAMRQGDRETNEGCKG